MITPRPGKPNIPELCAGGIDRAVQSIVALWRSLWSGAMGISAPFEVTSDGARRLPKTVLAEALHRELLHEKCLIRFVSPEDRDHLEMALLSGLEPDDDGGKGHAELWLTSQNFQAFDLVQDLLAGQALPADLIYYTARELRRWHGVALSAGTMRAFQNYTVRLRSWFAADRDSSSQHYRMFLLRTQLESHDATLAAHPEELSPDAYFDLVSAIGWLQPAAMPGEVEMRVSDFDAAVLVNRYFGLPTSIQGFDSMFGGSGLLLVDAPQAALVRNADSAESAQPIGGRTILITGPYGTGKSTLTLQMAIEVARKGGVTLIAAMEQTPEECLFSLEALGVSTRSKSFDTVHEIRDAMPLLTQPYDGKGVLAFLPIPGPPRGSDSVEKFKVFCSAVEDRLAWLGKFPLRLLIVDPINSVLDEYPLQHRDYHRQQLVALFTAAKRRGVNVWLTCERNNESIEESPFEENIADTVLRLAIDRTAHFERRTIQVRKSRLQREEPGQHFVTMKPSEGIRIYPSSATIARRAYQDSSRNQSRPPTQINVEGIDRILGPGALLRGDIIALNGPPGSSRTLVGVHFLFGSDPRPAGAANCASLLVSDATEEKMQALVELAAQHRADTKTAKSAWQIRLCPILSGLVEPSQILELINDSILRANRENCPIDRVMVSDLSRWETGMPLIAEDPAFGTALFSLLRRWGATGLLLADYVAGEKVSTLSDLVVNAADCVLEFSKLEFRGQVRQLVRATKSHHMAHRRDAFELIVDRGGVHLETYGALLRKDETGNVRAVNVRLFLHSDSPHHQDFNDRLVGSIRTSLTDAVVAEQWLHYDPEIFGLAASSAVDEVQVMQLDEFQLPQPTSPDIEKRFVTFESESAGASQNDYLDRLSRRIRIPGTRTLFAVPFYENISLMAFHTGRLREAVKAKDAKVLDRAIGPSGLASSGQRLQDLFNLQGEQAWEWLRKRAVEWEKKSDNHVFFSCPLAQRETIETYNCLFFEMLQAYKPIPEASDCKLSTWLSGHQVKKAAQAFRDLCYRSHRREQQFFETSHPESGKRKLRTFTQGESGEQGPVVWRHWYNTLSQMMWDLPDKERSAIVVQPLFDNKTTAGEWYLVVPAYSAAPELAWQIIRMVTAPDRELQRIYRGVGLPTRQSYYREPARKAAPGQMSPFFHVDRSTLRELVSQAFQRSQFPCYQEFSETISAHLQRILELPPQSLSAIEEQINDIVDNLVESIQYIQESVVCRSCRARKSPSSTGIESENAFPMAPSPALIQSLKQ
jgi:KaiC/GvpD/RAD55 family RecA-like ATPase